MQKISSDLIKEVALALGIDSAFIEKDYYATQLLRYFSDFVPGFEAKIVFTGGTCLSKAYHVIKRFSEDVDFRIILDHKEFTRPERRQIRDTIVSAIKMKEDFRFVENSLVIKNESQFFNFKVDYKNIFSHQGLKNHLETDFTFNNLLLKTESKEINSMLAEVIGDDEDKFLVECASPVEIAANKLSALLWRINAIDRDSIFDEEPSLVRHLYDLTILKPLLLNQDFIHCFIQSLRTDDGRHGVDTKDLNLLFTSVLSILTKNPKYRNEYSNQLENTIFAEDHNIDFETAINSIKELQGFCLSQKYFGFNSGGKNDLSM